ncbi:hypothetical protein ASE98_00770 [Pseudomonas sp. Leaf48]|uniref:hypothetical protein n=1 Tax=Pseudomonas sp. Leaf48 TaxID=1736221 RepID=UPI0007241285|nr:hypothetical protein [Pseudomonas sp. Leaf48]KQN55990.1 hypothetical protein ASE98_00770 [Pseudomonas sp. Leaf48]
MSTLRQKSFLATLALWDKPLIIGRPYGLPVLMLGDDNDAAFIFYFRCEGDYYNIYVRTKGEHFGRTLDEIARLDQKKHDYLFTIHGNPCYITTSTADVPTSFNILNGYGKILTLDNLASNKEEIILQTRSGNKLAIEFSWDNEPPHIILTSSAGVTLTLNILERNAPYLGFPGEV